LTIKAKTLNDIQIFATKLIKEAGQRLLADFGQVGSRPKGDFDLVTSADLNTEEFLKTEILQHYPTHQIIAEETLQTNPSLNDNYCWVIDPLDGTVNFALGIPFFSISLVLLVENKPVLGWVYDPIHKELFHAQKGKGSFLNSQPLQIDHIPDTRPLPVGGSSGLLDQMMRTDSSDSLSLIIQRFGKLRILGSQALHLCYVAAGHLRAAVSWESKLWDDAAGALIAQEAGAYYTNLWGDEIFPLPADSKLLTGQSIHSIAATPVIHQDLVAILSQLDRGNK